MLEQGMLEAKEIVIRCSDRDRRSSASFSIVGRHRIPRDFSIGLAHLRRGPLWNTANRVSFTRLDSPRYRFEYGVPRSDMGGKTSGR